jgi:Carboxypeptidase regulatory-like domain
MRTIVLKAVVRFLLIAMLCAGAGFYGHGQSMTQGAISGTVFDSTNAVIPKAAVLIHNDATAADIRLTTSDAGEFRAPQLSPGTYTVTITASGFNTQKQNRVVVQVNEVTELNPHLTTGSQTTAVEVMAEAPVLNFESAAYGGHLANTEIENVPINNRRWSALALTTPGVTTNSDGFGLLSFRAISPLLNNVQIDGADDNQAFFSEERGRTRAGYSTSQAAVREFQVNTGVYSAELGRAVGGVVNSVTKSGGNQLHGEVYFYNRNSSRSAFQPGATNTTYNATTNAYITAPYKPKDNRNQYGFGVGGPLIKDRLFWFYAFDQFMRNFPGTAKASNPTSFFTAPSTNLPAGYTCNLATGAVTGTPTTSTVNQQACLLAARLGYTSYAAGATAYNQQLQALLPDLGSVPRFGDQTINTPKLDWQINQKQHLSALYHRLRWDSPGGVQTQATNTYAIDSFGTDFVKLDYGVAILESLFTSHLTNELRYQYGRELNDEGLQKPSAYTQQNLTGTTGVPTYVGLFTSTGFNLGAPYYSFRFAYPDERKWQIGDTASYLLGKHNLKFGADLVHNFDLQNNLYQGNGAYTYSSSIVNYFSDLLSKGRTCNNTGSGVGSASNGFYSCYNSFTQGFGPAVFQLSTLDTGYFVQDDWKLTPRLTLNLGVRYDYESLPAPYSNLTTLPQTANHPSDKNNVAPRLGFAYDPFGLGKTVVRGGFGFYYGRVFNAYLLNTYYQTGAANSQVNYFYTPTTSLNGVNIAPTLPNVAAVPPPAAAQGPSIYYFDKNFQNPYAEQFDLAVQQEIGRQIVLSVSYIGALGRELPNYINVNLNPANTYTFNYVVGAAANGSCGPLACGSTVPVKVYSNKTQNGATSSSYAFNTPYPAYGSVTDVVSNINSNYHGLTFEAQKRASKYISFDAHYTWAHALDFNQTTGTAPSTNGWLDPFANARSNYGNSGNDIRGRFVAWAIFNAPGTSSGGALKYLTNGWSLKPYFQMQSGLPYTLVMSGTVPNQCYLSKCLEANGSGLAGTGVTYIPQIGRNTFRNPRTINLDMRAQKDFTFAEKYNLQLIGEAFNLANHQNVTGITTTGYILNTVSTNPAAPTSTLNYQSTFGGVTSANSNNAYQVRQIQLALRLVF